MVVQRSTASANTRDGTWGTGAISGSADFLVPERTPRDHVIVNKFSAPGSPESAGAYGLDRAAGEYSVYNTVNYRNSTVRDVQNELSRERSERFGFRSGSSVQASVHATNRNPNRFTGSSEEGAGSSKKGTRSEKRVQVLFKRVSYTALAVYVCLVFSSKILKRSGFLL